MPLISSSSLAAKLAARLFSPEGLWGMSGCAMACASGGFALYMTLNGPSPGAKSNDFPLFASVSSRAHRQKVEPAAAAPDQNQEVDPVVTGSIPERKASGKSKLTATLPEDPQDTSAGKEVLRHVILREIEGDSALVEIDDSLSVYRIGDQIPGAGRLVAMTQRNGLPALETSTGLIVENQ